MQGTPSDTPELRLERDGDIGFVVASNPARMNAFTAGTGARAKAADV